MNPERSYASHRHYESGLVSQDALPACYAAPESVDAWRHDRLLGLLEPLLRCYPKSDWVTVGDGQFGADAHSLLVRGHRAVATSLTDDSLAIAQRNGWISEYRAENAEALSLAGDSFDFVLCKHAYHHFPRPALAFYEMLRVCRVAAVLIEPIEAPPRLLDLGRTIAKRVLRGDTEAEFEPLGNFVYRLSVREVFKMMAALGGAALAVQEFNDCWLPRYSSAPARGSFGARATRAGIWAQDVLSRLRLMNFGLAAFVVFKAEPSAPVRAALQDGGFRTITIPRNPYLTPS